RMWQPDTLVDLEVTSSPKRSGRCFSLYLETRSLPPPEKVCLSTMQCDEMRLHPPQGDDFFLAIARQHSQEIVPSCKARGVAKCERKSNYVRHFVEIGRPLWLPRPSSNLRNSGLLPVGLPRGRSTQIELMPRPERPDHSKRRWQYRDRPP